MQPFHKHADPVQPFAPFSDHPNPGQLGWGVVGCGWVARDYAIPAIQASRNGRLVALCDQDVGAMADVGGEEVARLTDLGTMLARPDVQAVYVATPNNSHAQIVEAVAGAGKHVFCEKPMARTSAEAERMVAACRAAGTTYATAFDQRFHPAHRALQSLIADGALGRVTCVRIHYACWTPPDWTPDGRSLNNWRVDPQRAGGGAMIDLAPHGLDLTQMLLGEPLEDIACLMQQRVFDYPVDDGAVIIARSASGVLLSHTVAYNCPDVFPRRRLEVIGDQGRALAVNTMGQTPGGTLTLTDLGGTVQDIPFDQTQSPFQAQVEAFAQCLLGGTPFPFSPETDLHTMRLVERCGGEGEREHGGKEERENGRREEMPEGGLSGYG